MFLLTCLFYGRGHREIYGDDKDDSEGKMRLDKMAGRIGKRTFSEKWPRIKDSLFCIFLCL